MYIELIEYPDDKKWMGVKQRALVTVGKKVKTPPTEEWKRAILRARHSPIRYLFFSFYFEDLPTYVSTHLARHVHAQPYIQSQRNDRQDNYDREEAPQKAPVRMIWDITGEELLIIFNKRLCHQADPKTIKWVEKMRELVLEKCPEFEQESVRMCEYLGRCPEMKPCGYYDMLRHYDEKLQG